MKNPIEDLQAIIALIMDVEPQESLLLKFDQAVEKFKELALKLEDANLKIKSLTDGKEYNYGIYCEEKNLRLTLQTDLDRSIKELKAETERCRAFEIDKHFFKARSEAYRDALCLINSK